MKNKLKNVAIFLILFICSIIIIGSIYYIKEYPKQDFEVILFTFTTGVEKTAPTVVNDIIFSCAPPVILLLLILLIPTIKTTKRDKKISIKVFKKNIQLFPIKPISKHRFIYVTVIFIVSLLIFANCFGIYEYIKNKSQDTKIFEEYYVNAKDVNIEFPSKKRNLILILGESFENSVFSLENGGAWDYSIMPELEQLALDNTNFSNSETLGGALETYGANYSAAGNVATTSGVPLKSEELFSDANNYTGTGKYLPGLYALRRNIR